MNGPPEVQAPHFSDILMESHSTADFCRNQLRNTSNFMLGECVCEIFVGIVVTPHERAIESLSHGLSIARSYGVTTIINKFHKRIL